MSRSAMLSGGTICPVLARTSCRCSDLVVGVLNAEQYGGVTAAHGAVQRLEAEAVLVSGVHHGPRVALRARR